MLVVKFILIFELEFLYKHTGFYFTVRPFSCWDFSLRPFYQAVRDQKKTSNWSSRQSLTEMTSNIQINEETLRLCNCFAGDVLCLGEKSGDLQRGEVSGLGATSWMGLT